MVGAGAAEVEEGAEGAEGADAATVVSGVGEAIGEGD